MSLLTTTPTSGPLSTPEHLTDDALAATARAAAEWVAFVGLEGRYAVVRKPGVGSQWWRWAGDRWHPCDERLVRAAVQYALDDAYNRIARRDDVTAYRLDRLRDERWLWQDFARTVDVTRARLGLP